MKRVAKRQSKSRKPSYAELMSPRVLRRAQAITRRIRKEEAPAMQRLLDADRLSEYDLMITITI